MTEPEYSPFTPPVPGATAEQLQEFLEQRATFARRPVILPDPDTGPSVPPEPRPEPEPALEQQPRPAPSPVVWTGSPMPPPEQWTTPADVAGAPWQREAVCVALVHDRDPAAAITALISLGEEFLSAHRGTGVLPADEALTWAWAQPAPGSPYGYGTAVEAERLGAWTLIVEDNGYLASAGSTVVPFSAGTAVCVVQWGISGFTFWWVVDGTVVRRYDQDDARAGYEDTSTGRRLPQEDGMDLEADGPWAYGLTLMQRLTGVLITRDLLAATDRRIAIGIQPG